MSDQKDPPIQPLDYLSGVTVVDFGEARVARGMSRRPHSACKHGQLVYDKDERRVWCRDCETNVDAFDAFIILVENYSKAWAQVEDARRKLKSAMDHQLVSRAAKEIDQVWRGRHLTPCCPHCNEALLPEDFANGCGMQVSRELARAARKKKGPHNG